MRLTFSGSLLLAMAALGRADTVRYFDDPGALPVLTPFLSAEFGDPLATTVTETVQTSYLVQGSGARDLTFRFRGDLGSFLFSFGFYRITGALSAIDVSNDAGKAAYAQQALSGATLVFDDRTSDVGATATVSANGGDVLGFFLIPDGTIAGFNADPASFPVNGVGSATLGIDGGNRFPLFGAAGVNPGDADQLLSFNGTSVLTGDPTSLFAWEDLTRATLPGNNTPSDGMFADLVFTVEGVQAVPEPTTLVGLALGGFALLRRRRR